MRLTLPRPGEDLQKKETERGVEQTDAFTNAKAIFAKRARERTTH